MHSAFKIIQSRASLTREANILPKVESEGGCGVIGVACEQPIKGRHILEALTQMKNRGNGKGGGIAALGLSPSQLGVSRKILQEDYLIQIAYPDVSAKQDVENEFIFPVLDVDFEARVETVPDYAAVKGMSVKPSEVHRYFCRARDDVLRQFMEKNGLLNHPDLAEDELIYQNSYALNRKFYASLGEKKAFVLSHGKDLIVFKIVGYGDQVIQYYKLEDFPAHVWIGHHRYPTKGRVWHPGGAHPFVGLHEALVHNGDFANYHSVCEYLAQRNIFPLFLTDTEVAAYLFDLWRRVYEYPLEYLIEAMAPTTERDFCMLPEEKRNVYKEIQAAHIHGSPDGPWFFIVGRSEFDGRELHLLGITDTSMLRPQVFALQEDEVKIGLIASERQAIDACLRSLALEDSRFAAKADVYWNARGGSHTDGGAFIFTVDRTSAIPRLICTDKFGRRVSAPPKGRSVYDMKGVFEIASNGQAPRLPSRIKDSTSIDDLCARLEMLSSKDLGTRAEVAQYLISLLDTLHLAPYGKAGRSRQRIEFSLFQILRGFPSITENPQCSWVLVDSASREELRSPHPNAETLLIDVRDFPAEGENSPSALIVRAHCEGWRHVVSFDWRGQRFCGCGLGPHSDGFRIDTFGNPGDYLGSGLDGAEIYVHGSAQDQVAQIMKSGKLVIYGDVGQTFMYAAKGGEVYVLGNAAGRPLIDAVGKPRVIINGTCLDYLAESFMAGDPLNGGGFVILNGIEFDHRGQVRELQTPYPGGNLFSLASGGAIYLRDPRQRVGEDQLNGGRFAELSQRDWNLVRPYLEENERLFGIRLAEGLLRRGGLTMDWSQAYRKIEAVKLEALTMV